MQKNRSWKGTILLKNRKYKRTFLHRIWICHWIHSKRSQIYKRITLNRNRKGIKMQKNRRCKRIKFENCSFCIKNKMQKNLFAPELNCSRRSFVHCKFTGLKNETKKTFTLKKGVHSAQKRKCKRNTLRWDWIYQWVKNKNALL